MKYAVITAALFGGALFLSPSSHGRIQLNATNNNSYSPQTVATAKQPRQQFQNIRGVNTTSYLGSRLIDQSHDQTTLQPNQTKVNVRKDQKTNQAAQTPNNQPKIVTVSVGDTLSSLAESNGTTYERLYEANPDISTPDMIYPKQQMRVPMADENLAVRQFPVVPTSQAAIAASTAMSSRAVPTTDQSEPTVPASLDSSGNSVWDSIAACESGGNWAINTGNGFYGGLQFTLGSWQSVGGSGMPNEASRAEQISRGKTLQARSGWGNWPACTAKLGLR